MNVAELIEKLQRYPPDTLVMLRDWDYVALTAQSVADTDVEWQATCDALLATATRMLKRR